MLKQRVITAVLLLAVLLPALFYPTPEPFCAVTLVLIVGAGWEWARLNGIQGTPALLSGGLLGLALAGLWWSVGLEQSVPGLWWGVSALWVALVAYLLRVGVPGWAPLNRPLRFLVGWVLIGVAWWALAQSRYLGTSVLLSILTLVWTADIAAYFGGKAFGRRKLAPAISPGKSWVGVYSGVFGVLLLATAWVALESGPKVGSATSVSSLYGVLWHMGPWQAGLALLLLTGMSVAGDLVESLIKRSAGVKDSSGLLPGHGGVLDRVDALLPVLPLSMLFLTW